MDCFTTWNFIYTTTIANDDSTTGGQSCKANDRQIKSRKRASETELETVEHRASDRQCKAKRRANETEQGTSDVCKRSHVTCNLN